jgi:hypothetical protein
MTEIAHSPIGASSMYRWSACPGSVRLSAGVESKSSKYAEEGTEAHEWAAKVLTLDAVLDDVPSVEMTDAVKVYRDECFADVGAERLVEHKFDLTQVYPGLFGTADCVVWIPAQKLLRVIDFKYGAGIPVEVTGNPQLRYYALGALMTCGYHPTEVEMVIVQPRCPHPAGPVRRERISAADLIDFATELIDYAKATENPDAPVVPGDHCRFCPASGAGRCPAIREKANAVAARVFAPGVAYDATELADALRWAPVLEAWLKNMREFAYAEAEAGRCPPGFKLVAKRASRVWKDEASAEQACKSLGLGELEMYGEPNLVSPAQIEKALTARKIKPADRKAALDPLVESVSSGHTLVADSDPRPPVRQDAAEVFSNV